MDLAGGSACSKSLTVSHLWVCSKLHNLRKSFVSVIIIACLLDVLILRCANRQLNSFLSKYPASLFSLTSEREINCNESYLGYFGVMHNLRSRSIIFAPKTNLAGKALRRAMLPWLQTNCNIVQRNMVLQNSGRYKGEQQDNDIPSG